MRPRWSAPTGWLSYDSVAEVYDRVAVPWFEPMARDLVAAVEIRDGARVLDVGTGTGLTADFAREAAGARGLVVGVDPSAAMLTVVRDRRRGLPVRAMVPGLPFAKDSFDAVLANLVLSHVPDVGQALADMVDVLGASGRLGATAWGPAPEDAGDQSSQANGIIAFVRDSQDLPSAAPVKGARWEEELRDDGSLCDALTAAGLEEVAAVLHTYRHAFPIEDYVSGWEGLARYIRHEVGEARWQDFCEAAATKLRKRFGDTIISVKGVWIASGTVASRPIR